jgi:phospholipid/cholesterol/gamma-HCH transport system substrate-binding protein
MEIRARFIIVGLFALVAIVGGFAFVFWLNASGGMASRTVYKIRFEGSVSGLQKGASVLFNGIRVGEVTGLRLRSDDPLGVIATIAIDNSTPLRVDSEIGIESQGLMGTAAIALKGGKSTLVRAEDKQGMDALLSADPAAGRDLTQTLRQTLKQVDQILSDNADPLRSSIADLKIFSAALARNSDRLDDVMAGLQKMAGGGPVVKPKQIFDLAAPHSFPHLKAPSATQFVVMPPTAVVALQTQQMLMRAHDGELSQIGEALWSDSLPLLIQAKVVASFENAGFAANISAPADAIKPKFQILIDLRNFEISAGTERSATIEFTARIVAEDGHIKSGKVFHASVSEASGDPAQIVAAFNSAFATIATELITWTTSVI